LPRLAILLPIKLYDVTKVIFFFPSPPPTLPVFVPPPPNRGDSWTPAASAFFCGGLWALRSAIPPFFPLLAPPPVIFDSGSHNYGLCSSHGVVFSRKMLIQNLTTPFTSRPKRGPRTQQPMTMATPLQTSLPRINSRSDLTCFSTSEGSPAGGGDLFAAFFPHPPLKP